MASTVTPSVSHQDVGVSNVFVVRGTLAVGAGTYPANGLPVSFVGYVQASPVPAKNGTLIYGLSGYTYAFDDAHQTLRAFLGGTEVVTTTPAAVVADIISFEAKFPKV
jgi:hypothetical protein